MRGILVALPFAVLTALGFSVPAGPDHPTLPKSAAQDKLPFATGRIAPPPETFLAMNTEQQPSQPAAPAAEPELKYATGRVAPTKAMYESLQDRQVFLPRGVADFPDATEKQWDSRAHGWVGPIKNQGQCGSCWDFSGTGIVEIAFVKAGILKRDQPLSEQYTLSCYGNGGCNGDDNTIVLKHAKQVGIPLTSDYGNYTANSAPCKLKQGTKLYQIDTWGLADGRAGYEKVGNTQKIKNAIKACGSVGVAICADGRLGQVRPGEVFRGNNRQINHEVILVGWDDTKVPGKTCWIMRNSWGEGWGDRGYCLIEEGANGVGTQPVYAVVAGAPGPDPEPENINDIRRRYIMVGLVVVGAILIVVVGVLVIRKLKGTK